MAEFTYEILDFAGLPLAEIVPRDRSLRLSLAGSPSAQFSMLSTEAATYRGDLAAGECDILIRRDGVPLMRGPLVGVTGSEVTHRGGALTFAVAGVAELLADRFVPTGREIAAREATSMAWQLIDDTQALPYGTLGIVQGTLPASVARTKAWDSPAPVLSAIREIADLEGGFDWAIEPDATGAYRFDAYYPRRGSNRGVVLDQGRNVRAVNPTYDAGAGRLVNAATVAGANQVAVVVEDTPLMATYRRRERFISGGDSDSVTYLGDKATAEISRDGVVRPTGTIELQQGAPDASLDEIGLGDIVTCDIQAGWVVFAGLYRVTEIDVAIPNGGGRESLSLAVEPYA